MNILFCSAGRRVELLKDFRKSMDEDDRIIAADLSKVIWGCAFGRLRRCWMKERTCCLRDAPVRSRACGLILEESILICSLLS